MADLSSRLTIEVTRNSPNITRTGFGTPLILGYVDTSIIPPSERTRLYSGTTGLTEMNETDGFPLTHPCYLAAQALLSQTPRPTQFKIGRGAEDFEFEVHITPTTFVSGETISVTTTKDGTTDAAYEQTAGGVSIDAEVTALTALFNAGTWGSAGDASLTISDETTHVKVISTAANSNALAFFSGLQNVDIDDQTPDRGIATDLAAIEAYDPDWYCLCLADSFGELEIEAAATWIEGKDKICVAATQDSNVKAGTVGVAVDLAGLGFDRTALIFSDNSMSQYPAVAMAGRFLPKKPGEVVWADKSLSGVTASALTSTQVAFLDGDSCNHYTTTAGVGNLFPGVVCSGEFIDIIRLTDWVVATVREEIFSAMRANDKIPFTDNGVSVIESIVLDVLRRKMPLGFAEGSATFNAPLVSDVSAANKAARTLPDVSFGATFAGAILKIDFVANLAF